MTLPQVSGLVGPRRPPPSDRARAAGWAAARLRTLEVLSDVAVQVASSLDLQETLEHVARAVVDSLGFGVAVLNLTRGDVLEVAVVCGPREVQEALAGTASPRASWEALLERSTPLGGLRFVDGRQEDDDLDDAVTTWVPDLPVPEDEGAWHPLDALFAPLRGSTDELLGVLSVDLPTDGRRPGPARVELLERFAVQAALAIDRARMHTELAESAELFRLTFEDAPLGMALLDEQCRFVQTNRLYAAMAGCTVEEMVGRLPWDLVHEDDVAVVRSAVRSVLDGTLPSATGYVRTRDGATCGRTVATRIVSRRGVRVLVQVEDVTDQRRAEQSLRRQATTDSLTGLANRAQLDRHLADRLAARGQDDRSVAVLFCDLDHFKLVNDSHGHAVGDELLLAAAAAISGALRAGDLAGRLGGDEFVVVLDGLHGPDGAIAVAERIGTSLARPVVVGGLTVTPSVSIGIALAERGLDAEQLLARADAALYRAKAAGRGRWELFAPEMRSAAQALLALREQLRAAVEQDQFVLHHQPVVDLHTGAVVGHEALLRWQHPVRGLLTPGAFLQPLLEGELATAATDWVLDRAVQETVALDPCADGLFVSVNVSPAQLGRADFAARVQEVLQRHGMPAGRLWVEVTEDGVAGGARELDTLAGLRALGVHVAVDDFGSGYAGLLSLRDLPADVVKLDMAFTAGLLSDDASRAVVEAVVPLCRRLGREVVAEGVETQEQQDALVALGLRYGQGWHLGRPGPLTTRPAAPVPLPPWLLTAELDAELRRLDTALALATDREQVGAVALQAAARIVSADGGMLVVHEGDDALRTVQTAGYGEQEMAPFRTFPLDAPLPLSTAVSSGEPVWLGAGLLAGMLLDVDPLERRTHLAIAALPLRVDGRSLGGLSVSWTSRTEIDQACRSHLLALAARVAERLAGLG